MGDGQENCNGTQTDAVTALVDFLATDPTGSIDAGVSGLLFLESA